MVWCGVKQDEADAWEEFRKRMATARMVGDTGVSTKEKPGLRRASPYSL